MCQCIWFSQIIGDTKIKLFTNNNNDNNNNNNVYTIKICGMYKVYNKTIGL